MVFGLPRWATFVVIGVLTMGIFVALYLFVGTDKREIPLTKVEQAATCALSSMTVKMKRARAMTEHQYAMATIKDKTAKYTSPSEDRILVSLVRGCLQKGANKQEQIDAVNRLGVMLAYDDEYQRLMAPLRRMQDRALTQRDR